MVVSGVYHLCCLREWQAKVIDLEELPWHGEEFGAPAVGSLLVLHKPSDARDFIPELHKKRMGTSYLSCSNNNTVTSLIKFVAFFPKLLEIHLVFRLEFNLFLLPKAGDEFVSSQASSHTCDLQPASCWSRTLGLLPWPRLCEAGLAKTPSSFSFYNFL